MTITPPLPQPSQNSAFQYVPVPNDDLPAVYQLLAERGSARAVSAAPDEAPTDDFHWSDQQLAKIAAGSTTTTQVLTEVMDLLAANPGVWYSQDELAEATGRARTQLLVVWSKLGPHLSKHYGTTRWPIETRNGRNLTPPRAGSVHYSMTAEGATAWRRVRGH
jgi:hypothetical protein